jgi:DNA-binding IclR family transcriptional regulator
MLEVLAAADRPVSIAELAVALNVHRSIAYRILRTLEDFRLVSRGSGGVRLGAGLAELARGVARDLQAAALPALTAVANDLGMTAYLSMLDGRDCITLVSAEPLNQSTTIAYKPGARHPITAGADGVAMQMQLGESELKALVAEPEHHEALAQARLRGYAASSGEVVRGISAVAVPLDVPGHVPSALAVVYVETEWPIEHIGERLTVAATTVRQKLT